MEIERTFGPEHPSYTVSGWALIVLYEREIPKMRKRLATAGTLQTRRNLERTIYEMERGLLRETEKMRERGQKRPWWRV